MPKMYRRKQGELMALQHDGTDESAMKMQSWINIHGGQASMFRKGSVDYDMHNAYLKLEDAHGLNLVGPTSWVVMAAEGLFYVVLNRDFPSLYDPVENGDEHEVPD